MYIMCEHSYTYHNCRHVRIPWLGGDPPTLQSLTARQSAPSILRVLSQKFNFFGCSGRLNIKRATQKSLLKRASPLHTALGLVSEKNRERGTEQGQDLLLCSLVSPRDPRGTLPKTEGLLVYLKIVNFIFRSFKAERERHLFLYLSST